MDWEGRVWNPVGSRVLPFLRNFQPGSGAQPAPWEIDTRAVSQGKAAGA